MDLSHQTTPGGSTTPKLSHKKWRAQLKKLKRKKIRQAEALKKIVQLSPKTLDGSSTENEEESAQREQERQLQHNLWLERERNAMAAIEAKKLWVEQEQKRIENEQQQIREEWEERQKREKEEEEKRKEIAEAKKKEQEKMLKEATANENSEGEWHNPLAPPSGLMKEREPCPFFVKVGACRFGDRCSRFHDIPDSSNTILIPNMYAHFQLDQGLFDEYDSDLVLEYEDSETYQHFKDFYRDAVPEFKSFGNVVQFKVCCNYEPHLRGNVYVQYEHEDDAVKAAIQLNGRYYGGRQLSCQFSNVSKWKNAICGLFHQKRCPKGKNCNFLHVFRNPGNEFRNADFDFEYVRKSSDNEPHSRRSQRSYSERRRSRSRSPSVSSVSGRRRRSRSRERSMSREHRYKSSRRSYHNKDNTYRSHRHRSRSRSPGHRSRYSRSPSSKRNKFSRSRSRSIDRRSKSTASRSSSKSKQIVTEAKLKPLSPQDDSLEYPIKQAREARKDFIFDTTVSGSNGREVLGDADDFSSGQIMHEATTQSEGKTTGTEETVQMCNDNGNSTEDESEEALRAKLMTQISAKENGNEIQKRKHKKKHKKNKRKKHIQKSSDECSHDA